MHTTMSDGPCVAVPQPVLGTLHVWALGVGIVVCGQYFGWNERLDANGPVAMLAASLLVCLLFLAWTLTLSELAVAMPTAGGPLDWGLRAGGPWLGFVMGWSMLLECFFGGVATALAGGNYVAFLLDHDHPSATVTVVAGLVIVVLFFLLQAWGVSEQAWTLVFMTVGALLALAVFWIVAGMSFSWERAWPAPPLPSGRGWRAVVGAVPWALWWLIIIEGAALAAEDTRCPARSIPRGLTAAVLTTVVLLVFTLGTACGALHFAEVAVRDGKTVHFPLAEVLEQISDGHWPLLVSGFCTVALLGLVASYHGLLYSTSRQLFAFGRDHYLPAWLGTTHATRNTPVPALAFGSVLTAGFVIANLWFEEDTLPTAVLAAGFAALVLYLLSMVCLVILRRREPGLFHAYRAPLPRLLPLAVVLLSTLALLAYLELGNLVLGVALGGYAIGLTWFALRRGAIHPRPLATRQSAAGGSRPEMWLDRVAAVLLTAVLLAAVAIWVTAFLGEVPHLLTQEVEMVALIALLALALGVLAMRSLRRTEEVRREG